MTHSFCCSYSVGVYGKKEFTIDSGLRQGQNLPLLQQEVSLYRTPYSDKVKDIDNPITINIRIGHPHATKLKFV